MRESAETCIWIHNRRERSPVSLWGYIALQIPGGHLANALERQEFICILLVAWGIFAWLWSARTYHEP